MTAKLSIFFGNGRQFAKLLGKWIQIVKHIRRGLI